MRYINTTFAHGNGPYSRIIDWAIAVNNERERRNRERLPIVIPLVYPGRQENIMRENISNLNPNFFQDYPYEILLDRVQGDILNALMFKGANYEGNLSDLVKGYYAREAALHKHLDGKRELENFNGEKVSIDLRDCAFQLGFNNRIQTGLPNQYYTAGGAGPFDEILERVIVDHNFNYNKKLLRTVLPIAKRMIENQSIIFSNEPGVFSYDESRQTRKNEVCTPPFIHMPKLDHTELPRKGIYFLATGIDGIRESGLYNKIIELGMQIYAPEFSIKALPKEFRDQAIALDYNKINNPNILAMYARSGWSSVWLAHITNKGFLTPSYQKRDDPEILFNEKSIRKLGLGIIVGSNPKASLERSLEQAQHIKEYNQQLINKYGTLDGIKYAAERVVDHLESLEAN